MFVILIGYSCTERKKKNERRKGEMEGGIEDEREGKSKGIIVIPRQRFYIFYLNQSLEQPYRMVSSSFFQMEKLRNSKFK